VPAMSTRTLSIALALALSFVVAQPARACWDGFHAHVGRVVEMGGDDQWDLDAIQTRATWLGRIDALLPAGGSVWVEHGYVTVEANGVTHELEWHDGHYVSLFRAVALAVGATPAQIRHARSVATPVYVVQTGAFLDAPLARTEARAISDRDDVEHGFLEAGGFPADNPEAHVVTMPFARQIHRVYVGAFVDRAEADALAARLGHGAFVRAV
jgi:hypothetical protein